MAKLYLTNGLDSLDLNQGFDLGYGIQALSGATGFGLPPVDVQVTEGAGDGSVYRSSRTLVRDLDIPLDIKGRTQVEFDSYVSRLSSMLSAQCTLGIHDMFDAAWTMPVVRVGGGEFAQGTQQARSLQYVVTLRATDPYWASATPTTLIVGAPTVPEVFVDHFMHLPLIASQAIGTVQVNNTGDVKAYPIWTIYGPGNTVILASGTSGDSLTWTGTLAIGDRLVVDMKAGTIVNGAGANQYALLSTAPRFWALPPGLSTITASMLGIIPASGSQMLISWSPRRWMVV